MILMPFLINTGYIWLVWCLEMDTKENDFRRDIDSRKRTHKDYNQA